MDTKIHIKKVIDLINKFKINKPVIYFGLVFIFVFSFLMICLYPMIETHSKINSYPAKREIENNVNNKFGSSKQSRFEFNEKTDELVLYTIYYDKTNPDGTLIQKAITINMFNESFAPLIFLISLFLSTPLPIKQKLYRLLIALFFLEIYIMFKIYAIYFDNYNFPEFELVHFEGIWSLIIYYYIKLLKTFGSGINYIIVSVIWLIFSGITNLLLEKNDFK